MSRTWIPEPRPGRGTCRREGRATRGGRHASLALLAALSFAACGDGGPTAPQPITELPRALTAGEVALIQAGNGFAASLLAQVYRAQPDSTVFLSPLSASMALGMTVNGAQGATRDQMLAALGLGGMSMDEVNRSYRELLSLLQGLDSRVEVKVGNAIFHRAGFQMETPFLDLVRRDFGARVQGLDFNDPAAAGVINGWVRDATAGRIPTIVDPPINPLTMAFLLNAVYFKGDWTQAFDKAKTRSGPFHLRGGGTRDVRYMVRDGSVPYRSGSGWHAVDLPYGGGAWAMTVAVPQDGHDVETVVKALPTILDPKASWPTQKVQVSIPRFQLTWEKVLNPELTALGMRDAFDPGLADFTPMYRNARAAQLHVQRVKQKTFLKVDEVGTEAAAVTSVEVAVTSVGPTLHADRPFLLAIRERLSGTVLFAGLIIQAPVDG